ncbi:hypothetical protein TNCV_383041 [Trichonephila clavipes]|nr:hypothetical protein TNCV_383041 [Trichonephila clavipes]
MLAKNFKKYFLDEDSLVASYEWIRDLFQDTPEGLSTSEEEIFIDFTSSEKLKGDFVINRSLNLSEAVTFCLISATIGKVLIVDVSEGVPIVWQTDEIDTLVEIPSTSETHRSHKDPCQASAPKGGTPQSLRNADLKLNGNCEICSKATVDNTEKIRLAIAQNLLDTTNAEPGFMRLFPVPEKENVIEMIPFPE